MAYLRIGETDPHVGGLGCGPGCKCGPCRMGQLSGLGERYIPDVSHLEPERPLPKQREPDEEEDRTKKEEQKPEGKERGGRAGSRGRRGGRRRRRGAAGNGLGGLGWTVRFVGAPPGHETITTSAIGAASRVDFRVAGVPRAATLSRADIDQIIAGNRSVDLGWHGTGVAFAFAKDEQKRHALRREYGQPQADALRDILASLRAQHAGILAERDPAKRMRRIGQALHLVQDSFSPAHTCRRPASGWCVAYVRNYGRGGVLSRSGVEHLVPKDDRDEIARSAAAAAEATHASRQYLQIISKALYGLTSNPDAVTARSEAASEFASFLTHRFRSCVEPEGYRFCRP